MTSTTHPTESNAPALHVALELSTKEWWLTMGAAPSSKSMRRRIAVGDQAALTQALATAKSLFHLSSEAPVRSCYEAGRDGFWPHRLLTALGEETFDRGLGTHPRTVLT